jgi:tight adherence protein C
MILAATLVTFLATVTVLMTVAYVLAGGQTTVASRLAQLWQSPTQVPKTAFKTKQKERAQRLLQVVGKIVPASSKGPSNARTLLMRAGIRHSDGVVIFRGAKLLTIAGLLSLVYFTGLYTQNLFLFAFAAAVGFLGPDIWLSQRIRRRQHRIRLALPDALDLLVVCVEAGLGLDQALARVSEELEIAHPVLSEELQLLNIEMRLGRTRIEALRELARRTGAEDLKALVAMLIQTERFGTSVARSLRVHSDNLRTKRRQRAEEQAAKTPVKMVPVLVFFIFPALFVVILGPAVITLVRQLLPMLGR